MINDSFVDFFNCRDLSTAGIFIRNDYSTNCESEAYNRYSVAAILGLLVCSLGIPVFFYFVIRNSNSPTFSKAAEYLSAGVKRSCKYFEVVNILRKFILVSCSAVISEYLYSQFLFMLGINILFLIFVINAQPYVRLLDGCICQLALVTECFVFIIFQIYSSAMDDANNMSDSGLRSSVLSTVLIVFISFVPVMYINNFYLSKKSIEMKESDFRSTLINIEMNNT